MNKLTRSERLGQAIRGWLIPELHLFPDESQRARAYLDALKQTIRARHWRPLVLLTLPLTFVLSGLLERWRVPDELAGLLSYATWAAALFGVGTIGCSLRRSRMRRFVRQRLADQGIPICINCAYDLTGNESGICP